MFRVPDFGFGLRLRLAGALAVVGALWGLSVAHAHAGYAEEVQADRPAAYWRFKRGDGRPGTQLQDEQGQHPAIVHGSVRLEPGLPGTDGRAARFDGQSAYLEVAHGPAFALNALSVEFWLKSTQAWDHPYWPASATLMTKATPGAGSGDWSVHGGSKSPGRNQGRLVAASGPAGAGTDCALHTRGRMNDGQWHHVVWSRTAAGECRLYLDGRLEELDHDGGGPILNTRPIQIGGEALLPGGTFFTGCLAEVALYSTALPEEGVLAHYLASGLPDAGANAARPLAAPPSDLLVLTNRAGLRWELERREPGWALGRVLFEGKPVDSSMPRGMLRLWQADTDEEVWLPASAAIRLGPHAARLSGQAQVEGRKITFAVDAALAPERPVLTLTPRWSVDRDLAGWEVCLSYHETGLHNWRVTVYPFAGNAGTVDLAPMICVGVPAVLAFREDLSLVTLFGIDAAADYLNPNTWNGTTGFHFRNKSQAPHYRVGGGRLARGVNYTLPLQVFFSGAGQSHLAITELVKQWIACNRYQVQPMFIRTPDEALALYLKGRRATNMWKPGMGYQLQDLWAAIYLPVSPQSAYFEYLLFEQTGDTLWRERCLQQMDFVLKAQVNDPGPLHGYIHTCYLIDKKSFNSDDRGSNPGYKVDMNVHTARYMLQVWERLKQKEGVDRRDWYEAAVRAVDWALAQQNPDGGLPQKMDYQTLRKSVSVCSGRAMAGLPSIARITGNGKYLEVLAQLEGFLRRNVEARYWYTGQHPDLYPEDFESDSVWCICEYWLDKHARTGDPECLARAEANAWFAFLMLCPGQLSWVRNPTQTCHAEQLHFLQYSNYAYHNRKLDCLSRLGRLTGNPLFTDLFARITQCGFWAQVTEGNYCGAQHERMADPWKKVSGEVDSKGSLYLNELSLDANLQLLEMGVAGARP